MEANAPALVPSGDRTALPVILAGLATTTLALFGVWAANQASDSFNIMSWYGYYIIPIGAVLVGLVAGSGYGLASWVTGVRISRTLLWVVICLQVLAYFLAQYIDFRHLLSSNPEAGQVGFLEFFDETTRSFAWTQKDGSAGSPLGAWGYLWRCLEIAGFGLGGLIVPLILKAKPYCQSCQRYMRTKALGLLPAGVPPKKIKKKDLDGKAEFDKAHESAWNQGMLSLEEMRKAGQEGKFERFNQILDEQRAAQKDIAKLTTRIAVSLSYCPSCHNSQLNAVSLSGQGNKIARQELGISKVDPGLSRELV